MADIRRLSEALYIALCYKIGTQKHVSLRRNIVDLNELIENESDLFFGNTRILSGSNREGFRLSGSDKDYMFWPRDHKVIFEVSQMTCYDESRTTFILMECLESRPGFVRLQLLTPSTKFQVASACVRINHMLYLSSSLYRMITLYMCGTNFKEHGPCANLVLTTTEFDYASCFSCDFWPPLASPWLNRCHVWPSINLRNAIYARGCNVMAIGSKESPMEQLEWRLSFSQAEQRLVYAMNHSQFLVYGLLKLFLKEVISRCGQGNLMCSYFMKTVVFWEIQENNISSWIPQNILLYFWVCFKRIIKWVHLGECPNFFIPQNNMFLGKVWGPAQNILFKQLYKLYKQGFSCLLYCHSIRSYLWEMLCIPESVIDLNYESCLFYMFNVGQNVTSEIALNFVYIPQKRIHIYLQLLQTVMYLSKTSLIGHQRLFLYLRAIKYLVRAASAIHRHNMDRNRQMFIAEKLSLNMLKTATRSGSIADKLYLAMYLYSTCRYTYALSVLETIEAQLSRSHFTCDGNGIIEEYILKIGGQHLLDSFVKQMLRVFPLDADTIVVDELTLEHKIKTLNDNGGVLWVPPHVMLWMLYVFCFNQVDNGRRQCALYKLYTLVHHGIGTCIPEELGDISYQILGICQEICGDFHAAINSYSLSLKCKTFNKISRASLVRMEHAFRNI